MALKWAERQRPVPVRTVMEIDHEAFPEAIGVMFYSPHGDDEALYRVWRNLAGDTVIDDGFSSEQSIFPTLSEALASITVKEADKLGRWLQSKLR